MNKKNRPEDAHAPEPYVPGEDRAEIEAAKHEAPTFCKGCQAEQVKKAGDLCPYCLENWR